MRVDHVVSVNKNRGSVAHLDLRLVGLRYVCYFRTQTATWHKGPAQKKEGSRLRGGRARHTVACAWPDPLAAPTCMGGACKLCRGRAQVAQDLSRRPNMYGD